MSRQDRKRKKCQGSKVKILLEKWQQITDIVK